MPKVSRSVSSKTVSFPLPVVPPFRLDRTVWALRRRPDNAVDRWDGETYRRVLVYQGIPIEVAVQQTGSPQTPQLQVTAKAIRFPAGARSMVQTSLERLLGTRIDLNPFYRLARQDARIRHL